MQGRSNNPVALLFDTLLQPNADIGEHHPPALSWKHLPSKEVSHVVLGSGRPGGSWHDMQPRLKSLSTARWLELPIYGYTEWEEEDNHIESCRLGPDHKKKTRSSSNARVCLGDVADYYASYVDKMGLQDNFLNVTDVTQLQRIPSWISSPGSATPPHVPENGAFIDSVFLQEFSSNCFLKETCSGPASENRHSFGDDVVSDCHTLTPRGTSPSSSSDSDDTGIDCCSSGKICYCRAGFRWHVRGKQIDHDGREHDVVVCARNLVLASGVNHPRRLHVPGEELPYVSHSFSDLPSRLSGLAQNPDPVVVVGAGLTAADAILLALSKGFQVIHVFHQDACDPKLIYHKMPPQMYSEYSHVSDLMQGKALSSQYLPLEKHHVTEFKQDGVCIVCDESGSQSAHRVSLAQVLIGSESELVYLPRKIVSKLGIVPDQPIHTKTNPVDVDPYSFQCEYFPSLYAAGPLVGDNFVRFVLGGALGITKSLLQSV